VTGWRSWARPAGGAVILAVLLERLGTGPFVDALRATDAAAVVVAIGVTAVTTACCAWRWRLVARGLGVELPVRAAISGYYRSQFLNGTLPGGVLGDVDRAVRHGRHVGDLGRSARSVAWERSAGQLVQVVVTVAVLLVLPSPLRSALPLTLLVAALAVLGVALASTLTRRTRVVRAVISDARRTLLAQPLWPGILLTSVLAGAGHVVVFLVAARAVDPTGSTARVLPLALVVLLASAIPFNVAGWGPREGAAAWAFGAAGLGATQGATIAVVYGVLALVATLPGAVLMAVAWLTPSDARRLEGAARG
jgi:glycosyltransferase 2 family protein